MTEGKAETATERSKSPVELAQERVAPEGYSWLTNFPRTSDMGLKNWLKDLQRNDPTITGVKIIKLAYNSNGELIKDKSAAYVTRESSEESELLPTEPKPRQSFISKILRRR